MKEINFAKRILLSNFKRLSFPYKLTYALTYRCNSKCKICRIWEKEPIKELSVKEIELFFKRNNDFNWVDLTGGEVFLRKDLLEIIKIILANCPNLYLLHIPTNGLMTEKIIKTTKAILNLTKVRFIISLALDGPPAVHDQLRGIKGSWQKAVKTYQQLKKIEAKNFEVYFGMTLFGENYNLIEESYQSLKREIPFLKRSDLHFNLAHHSGFFYSNLKIKLGPNDQIGGKLASFNKASKNLLSGIKFLESGYQKLILKYLNTQQSPLPCQALSASVFIDPGGDLYPCAIWEKKIANLKEANFDLKKIWESAATATRRQEIVLGRCPGCWTPCEAYQTILGNLLRSVL